MNIQTSIKLYFSLLSIMLINSCSNNNDDYNPLFASAMSCGVLISVEPAEEYLLSNTDFTDEISIYGNQSNRAIPFTIKKIVIDTDERNYISFNAEIPDMKNFKFKKNNPLEADGQSIITLKRNEREIKLQCSFKYICAETEFYGNNSIILEKIECEGKTVSRGNSQVSDIVLHLNKKMFSLE